MGKVSVGRRKGERRNFGFALLGAHEEPIGRNLMKTAVVTAAAVVYSSTTQVYTTAVVSEYYHTGMYNSM